MSRSLEQGSFVWEHRRTGLRPQVPLQLEGRRLNLQILDAASH